MSKRLSVAPSNSPPRGLRHVPAFGRWVAQSAWSWIRGLALATPIIAVVAVVGAAWFYGLPFGASWLLARAGFPIAPNKIGAGWVLAHCVAIFIVIVIDSYRKHCDEERDRLEWRQFRAGRRSQAQDNAPPQPINGEPK